MTIKNKTYWYVRLRDKDIFNAKLQMIKKIPVIGYMIIAIYFELVAKSIETGGVLTIQKNSGIDSWQSLLAGFVNEPTENLCTVLTYLEKEGFIEIEESDSSAELFIPLVDNNTGRSSLEADRVRRIDRAKKQALIEEEQRLMLIETHNSIPKDRYGIFSNVFLTAEEYLALSQRDDFKKIIDRISYEKDVDPCYKETITDYEKCISYEG